MKKEERELWRKYKEYPSLENRNALLEYHYKLLVYIASRMVERRPPKLRAEVMDMAHEAVMKLPKLYDKFDPSRGSNFIALAFKWVHGSMERHLIRFDDASRRHARQKARPDKHYPKVQSLSDEVQTDQDTNSRVPTVGDLIENPDTEVQKRVDDRDEVEYLMQVVSPRDKRILDEHFYKGKTLKEIAQEKGCHPQSVSSSKSVALAQMRIFASGDGVPESGAA